MNFCTWVRIVRICRIGNCSLGICFRVLEPILKILEQPSLCLFVVGKMFLQVSHAIIGWTYRTRSCVWLAGVTEMQQ